jgi:pimeloyl-ACP methyl ester carboxylesterase
MKLGSGIGHVAGWVYGRPPVIFTIRRGSSLITDLRLQWLEMRAQARVKKAGGAIVVQLLGTVDDLVSPEDNLDLEVGKDFFYIEVPRSGHRSVIAMDQKNDEDGGAAFRQRALLEALGNLSGRTQAVSPVETSMQERDEVTDVVFIIHGIRDEGYWAEKIAYRVKLAGQSQGRVVAAVTSTYGYFPMLSFLTPGARQEKVEWLMDRYTEARAKYPNAERFHYIGHSHGTYLLAKALQDYPSVRFDNVVFAGSVVRQEYEWNKLVPERVKSVHNFVATSDWVVAFFPKALQSLDIQDLGSAGHDGFTTATELGPIQELPETYIIGGHSSALQEALWDGMAVYTMTGKFQLPQGAEIVEKEQSWWVVWPGKVAPVLWLIIASAVVLGFRIILKMRIREWKKTLAIVVYCMVLWTILTEV